MGKNGNVLENANPRARAAFSDMYHSAPIKHAPVVISPLGGRGDPIADFHDAAPRIAPWQFALARTVHLRARDDE